MKMKILLLIGFCVSLLFAIGFASAQLIQNEQTDASTTEESDNGQCDGLGSCNKTSNGNCSGDCDGSCNSIEKRNYKRGYGPGDGNGN